MFLSQIFFIFTDQNLIKMREKQMATDLIFKDFLNNSIRETFSLQDECLWTLIFKNARKNSTEFLQDLNVRIKLHVMFFACIFYITNLLVHDYFGLRFMQYLELFGTLVFWKNTLHVELERLRYKLSKGPRPKHFQKKIKKPPLLIL